MLEAGSYLESSACVSNDPYEPDEVLPDYLSSLPDIPTDFAGVDDGKDTLMLLDLEVYNCIS